MVIMYYMLCVQMTSWNIRNLWMVWIKATSTELLGQYFPMLPISKNGIRRIYSKFTTLSYFGHLLNGICQLTSSCT